MARRFKILLLFLIVATALSWFAPLLSQRMAERPAVVKLGYTPPASVLKLTTGEYRYSVAELITLNVLMYYGSLVAEWKNQIALPPEYFNIFRTLETALQLDPYNADVYYFSQAVFTWDAGRVAEVNRLLEYGMKYRTWDPMLPFFAGFNAAYFLKDYDTAACHMRRAAEISGNSAMARLASRYYYESGSLDLAVGFLEDMIRATPSHREVELYQLRRDALVAVRILQEAVEAYRTSEGHFPEQLDVLVSAGILDGLPKDPYGGRFYIDKSGDVRSTSKLALTAPTEMQERGEGE